MAHRSPHSTHVHNKQQETKWKEAIRYYDPIVQKQSGGGAEPQLLNVPAVVLANLCVAYIMTSQNEAAEELMRKIEKEVRARACASVDGWTDGRTDGADGP